MPALSAYRWNPVIAALYQRMQERGKEQDDHCRSLYAQVTPSVLWCVENPQAF